MSWPKAALCIAKPGSPRLANFCCKTWPHVGKPKAVPFDHGPNPIHLFTGLTTTRPLITVKPLSHSLIHVCRTLTPRIVGEGEPARCCPLQIPALWPVRVKTNSILSVLCQLFASTLDYLQSNFHTLMYAYSPPAPAAASCLYVYIKVWCVVLWISLIFEVVTISIDRCRESSVTIGHLEL